jgi:hypothetical protein
MRLSVAAVEMTDFFQVSVRVWAMKRVGAVVALSVFVGSGWLLIEAYPSKMGFPFAGCVHFTLMGLVGLAVALREGWGGWTRGNAMRVAVAGLGVFVLPGFVGQLVAGAVSGSASVALYCAVPLLMVLGVAAFGQGSGRGLLIPSLVGLFGALLVFSVEIPESMRRVVGLAVVFGCSMALAGAGVWMFRLMQGVGTAHAVALVGITGAVVLGGYGLWVGWPRMSASMVGGEVLRCLVFDLPVVWVTVWLTREVPPAKLAARFLIAPVVASVEGYAMVRGAVEMRSAVALVLMVVGAGMLLVKEESDEVPGLRLR